MMTTFDFQGLILDVRAAGIPYEPDPAFPLPVRHRAALYIAIGYVCERSEMVRPDAELRALGALRRRLLEALRWIEALGKRSRWASWFERMGP